MAPERRSAVLLRRRVSLCAISKVLIIRRANVLSSPSVLYKNSVSVV